MTRVVVFGAGGRVGSRLELSVPSELDGKFLTRAECDITNAGAVLDAIEAVRPEVVINAAAYTAVDDAESDPGRAFAVNAEGPRNVAAAAASVNARMIHISTDYVFDGETQSPYTPEDRANPLNVYGKSKLEGEVAVRESNPRSLVIRTSWLYDTEGRNFLRAVLGRMMSGQPLRVVDDQVGSPTSAAGLARIVWICATHPEIEGIHHWAGLGRASWYEFAVAIQELAISFGLVKSAVAIEPVTSAEYGTPARRPPFSVLDSSALSKALGRSPDPWREALADSLSQVTHA
ncbi:MAG TPA: dTDP-4-dehydrorhamnose reductase [Gemmatimonadaceae bacterium]|nr:dTDP-4-dehydrorhamnose reductase [Gemmatimonadaceae bacterium]